MFNSLSINSEVTTLPPSGGSRPCRGGRDFLKFSSDVNEARTLEAEAEAGTLEAEAEAEAKTLEAEAEAEAGNFGLEAEAGFEAGLSHKSKKNFFVTHIKI